jgi:transposase
MDNIAMENLALQLEESEKRIEELEKKNVELEALVKYYEEQFRLLQHKRFGSSSEKTKPQEQPMLFDETENAADKRRPEPALEEITYTRRKREGKREEDLSTLPVEVMEHALPEGERICSECGGSLHVMGHETRRELKIIPAQVTVVEHVREVYSCRECEKNATSVPVVKAPLPEPIISGSLASPSSVAHIMVQKYVNAVPLYRQEQELLRNGVELSRQTMANWLMRCSEDWLRPLYDRMREQLMKERVLHADETVLQVLREPGKEAKTNSYMWLYRTSGAALHAMVLYEYQPTRSSSHPQKFLETFQGYLHTDGYAGYNILEPRVTLVGCWAHVRRKFDEALKAAPPEQREGSASRKGLEFCNQLFELERGYEKLSLEERYEKRLEQSKPTSDAFFEWAESSCALPKSALGKAVHYALSQRPHLENLYLDGRLELSNNRAERSIKPFVIGRKNWLFSATPKGARASSVIYSILETAKENALKLFEYIEYLLESLPGTTGSMLDSLLPWSDSLPDKCRVKKPD